METTLTIKENKMFKARQKMFWEKIMIEAIRVFKHSLKHSIGQHQSKLIRVGKKYVLKNQENSREKICKNIFRAKAFKKAFG